MCLEHVKYNVISILKVILMKISQLLSSLDLSKIKLPFKCLFLLWIKLRGNMLCIQNTSLQGKKISKKVHFVEYFDPQYGKC